MMGYNSKLNSGSTIFDRRIDTMRFSLPIRAGSTLAAIIMAFGLPLFALPLPAQAHKAAPPPPPPHPQTQPAQQSASGGVAPIERKPARPGGLAKPPLPGEHLNEWLNRHSNLTPDQQQQALAHEPGFSELPPQTQQRMRERLAELSAMSPEKRQHLLERNETMEHLNPTQREEVRGALKQLNELPPDQRRYVARTFRGLRELSPAQRQNVLNSERFNHLTDAQRACLTRLINDEPLLPPPYDAQASAPTPQQPAPPR